MTMTAWARPNAPFSSRPYDLPPKADFSPWWNDITRDGLPYLNPNKPRPARYADYSEEAWLAACA